ncbi:MAG: histone H1 [Mucilaginibacter sp.]|uniref:histone H1 n=1 Tax=Mucilaginibacter sp. TaxID=1882438 RepID=UPI0032674ED6
MSAFQKLKDLVAATEANANAFHTKGNKAAGTRLRKAYQKIKILAQAGRAEVTEQKNKAK